MRSRCLLAVIAVAVSLAVAAPATARPLVRSTWRAEPEVAGVAVDRAGRVYTVSNVSRPSRTRVELRALRSDGSLRWERIWRPADASVSARAIAVGPGGIVLVAGAIHRIGAPEDCDEIWAWGWALRAWGPDGHVRWQRTQPGWRTCDVFGTSGRAVAAAGDTVAMVIGYGSEYSANVRIAVADLDGRWRWIRDLEFRHSQNEVVRDVAVGLGDAVYLAASVRVGAVDTFERDQDAVLVKLAPDGAIAWRRTVPEPVAGGAEDPDSGTGVGVSHGAVYFAARVSAGEGQIARIARYTAAGSLRWERHVSGISTRFEGPFVRVWAGGPVVAGSERNAEGGGSHVSLRAYDRSGSQRWHLRLGPAVDRYWGATAFDARGGTLVASGRPSQAWRWSRVWVLG